VLCKKRLGNAVFNNVLKIIIDVPTYVIVVKRGSTSGRREVKSTKRAKGRLRNVYLNRYVHRRINNTDVINRSPTPITLYDLPQSVTENTKRDHFLVLKTTTP